MNDADSLREFIIYIRQLWRDLKKLNQNDWGFNFFFLKFRNGGNLIMGGSYLNAFSIFQISNKSTKIKKFFYHYQNAKKTWKQTNKKILPKIPFNVFVFVSQKYAGAC